MHQQTEPVSNTYFKFKSPKYPAAAHGFLYWLKHIFTRPVSLIVTRPNPTFYKNIPDVKEWIVEYDTHNDFPYREVGLDANGHAIMIMPWKNNYGYWSDKKIRRNQFINQFGAVLTTQKEFENHWKTFEENN